MKPGDSVMERSLASLHAGLLVGLAGCTTYALFFLLAVISCTWHKVPEGGAEGSAWLSSGN